jgi:diacylglycerol kinase
MSLKCPKCVKGVRYATKGIFYAMRTEQNLRIQLVIGFVVLCSAILLKIPKLHVLILLIVSFLVIILELLNTAVEKLIDILCPHYNKKYGLVKDIVGGVALLGVVLSVIIGVAILLFPMVDFIQQLLQ